MTQALATFHLSHGPKNRPTLVFLPGALIPPNAIAPVTRIVKLRAIGVGWLEGAGPHDLHSVAARVAILLRELGPTVLIGHSVGTPIAALAAAIDLRSTKNNVVGLVLSNSGANTKGHGDVESVIERVLQTWGPPLWKAMTERSLGSVCPAELVDSFMTYPRRITAEATVQSLRSLQQTDLTSMLSELSSLPTAVVHGNRDPARTLSHAQSLSDGIPGSRLVVLQTGHTSCVEAPEEFAKVIHAVVEQGLRAGNGSTD
jgi:pimeloyl-ACP methyl ester carboxylesterase